MAYHLSVLKDMFPRGINVLSLFSGIGGVKISLYRLSIPLKADVQELNDDRLEQLISRFGGFALVFGGISCLVVFITTTKLALDWIIEVIARLQRGWHRGSSSVGSGCLDHLAVEASAGMASEAAVD
ncbi:DNA (cytosine-5)-methyltransferase DRM1A-like [Hibiscus syriacus]|uniref:DNA (cytosine-5)-methyltransferase DRM1A-like n=1 Tax=Hibiscus syriacus TaxID=106335 RepID=UPI001924D57D|nr:DNA (cytosine-5)-methyltransferase DRM1A-like [Hibiscus syriacus]